MEEVITDFCIQTTPAVRGSSYGGCGGPTAGSGTKCGRWNPTAEQVKVLTDLFRSGLRTPSTDQIQKISAELSFYGKIESKNVFYWFQNHKARERQKRRRVSKDNDSSCFHLDHHLDHHPIPAPTPFKCFAEINQVPYESDRPIETLQLFPLSSYHEPESRKIRVFSDQCKENNPTFAYVFGSQIDHSPLDLRLSFF